MKRFSISILIALIALLTIHSAHAASVTTEVHNVVITDFSNGHFVGALQHLDGDSYKPITFEALDGNTYEDLFSAYGDTITMTLDIEEHTTEQIAHAYSTEYGKMIDLKLSYMTPDQADHIVGYCSAMQSFTQCQLDGKWIQAHGFITNGEIYKLRAANAYSTHGMGYLLQNGNLISYAVTNDEETPTHTLYIALVLR
jgi:hypothetical protein